MSSTHPQLVEIYRAPSTLAHAIRISLEEAGIKAYLEGDLQQGAVGELPLGWVTPPRILVEQSQAEAGMRIIESYAARKMVLNAKNSSMATCLACGLEMQEDDEQCESCGWSYLDGQPVD